MDTATNTDANTDANTATNTDANISEKTITEVERLAVELRLEREIAKLELSILQAIRGFEDRTRRRIIDIRTHARTLPVEFDQGAYYPMYTSHVEVSLKSPLVDAETRRSEQERWQKYEEQRKLRETAPRETATNHEAGF